MKNLKTFLTNRNAVVILSVLAGVVVLWIVYNMTLTKAISPVRVPVAKQEITAGTVITSDLFEYVEVSNDFLKNAGVIVSSAKLLNRYVNRGTSIPAGGMFYNNQIVDKENFVKRDIETFKEGYTIYWLAVDNTTTYANSIYPGDKIDLWLNAKNSETANLIVYEEFITSIDVIAVKDASGNDVFDVNNNGRTPKWIEFAVTEEMAELLNKIEKLPGLKLYPVPKNKAYTTENAEVAIANPLLVKLVDSLTINYNSTKTVNE